MDYPQFLTALCIWREARSQSLESKRAVCHVILNRASRHFRGTDPISVILAPKQFSSFNAGDPNSVAFPRPGTGADWVAWLECVEVAANPGPDPTLGALMYHACRSGFEPSWATQDKFVVAIGSQRFYKA